ncbi:MAG: CotH kinase family protein [Opitutaceae bacterium]|nr:CotH kinase family protein [Opitutaceae bacterium]
MERTTPQSRPQLAPPRGLPRAPALALLLLALLAPAPALRAEPVISEFMASNTATLADQDQAFSDWIEVHNPDPTAISLGGWYLTDTATNKTRWQFPAVVLPAGGYLVVFASNKNRRVAGAELHTNFALAAEGEYLGLIKPDGVTVVSEYAPTFPPQSNDISYGLLPLPGGGTTPAYFPSASPGAANIAAGAVSLAATVRFSRPAGPFSTPFQLTLSGAGPSQHIRFVSVPPGPAGAIAVEPTETSPRYAGPLTISTNTILRAAVFSDDLKTRGLSAPAQYFALQGTGARAVTGFASKLPVLVIEQHGYGGLNREDLSQPAWLHGFPGVAPGGASFGPEAEFVAPVAVTVRGSSSVNFPKKNYNVEILNDLRRKTARPLFGSRPFDEWALIGPWLYDPSLLRNSYVYALSNRIGRWAPRTQPVEVFLNTDGLPLDTSAYVGVYALTDKIEFHPDRVAASRVSTSAATEPDITGGYLLKIDEPDADEYAWTPEYGLDIDTLSSVVVASPKADRLSNAQRAYIRGYVQQLENALHEDRASGWRTRKHLNYLDRPSWIDHHILNTFAANPDAFERSAFFYKPRNGKLIAGPVWDFDRALGSSEDERSFQTDLWSGEGAVQPWHFGWWGVIATDPDFRQEWIDRWQSLRRDAFADANLTALADQLAAAIGPEAAARDAVRWADNVSSFGGTHAGEMAHIRSWLVRRGRWIDSQFVPPPGVTVSGTQLILSAPPGTQIAYTLDGSDPRAERGDIAPNATVVTGSATIAASANLHARSYRAADRDAFPGSPWSSVVGGVNSTPLSPPSRVINLSSRAVVGQGENALIMGVVVADSPRKTYLSRAIGPTLAAFGTPGTVPDPQLAVFGSDGRELARNHGWSLGPDAARVAQLARTVGAFPLPDGSADSALVLEVGAGAYSLLGTTPSGRPGIGLAELYETDATGRTVNISTRAQVGTNDDVLIGGFVVAGAAHKRMLIRAIGPTLRAFGVNNALTDPVLTVYSGASAIASNDRWAAGPQAAAVTAASERVNAFALAADTEDAVLLLTVAPGAYTAEVRGKGGATGVALLEIYEVP